MADPRQNLDTSLKLIVDAAMRDVAEASILIEQRKRVPRAITEALRNHVRKLILCLAEIAPRTQPEIEAIQRENAVLRSMIRVNAMRDHGMSHAEIDAAITAALTEGHPDANDSA